MATSNPAMNKVAFFRANYNGTTWNIYSDLTGVVVAAAPDDAAYTLTGLIENGQYEPQDDGTLTATFTQYNDDEAFSAFLDAVVKTTDTATTRPEVIMEDGFKLTASATSGDYIVMIAYTTTISGTPAKVKTIAAVGNIAKTSGAFGTKYEEWTAPSLVFNGVLAPADLTIPMEIFDMYDAATNTDGVLAALAVTADQTIPKGSSFIRKYFAKK